MTLQAVREPNRQEGMVEQEQVNNKTVRFQFFYLD